MEKSLINQKRNRLFLHLFAIGLLFHTLSTLFIPFEFTSTIPYLAIVYCLVLYILQKVSIPDRCLQILILGGLNGFIFYFNFESPYYIHILLFIYPVFVASLYHSIIPSLILLPISLIEISYLFTRFFNGYQSTIEFADLYVILFLLFLMCLTAIMHSLFIQKAWNRMVEQQFNLERALDSKEGYLHLFFENAKDGIAVFDLNSRIIEINPAFEDIYGWNRKECIGKRIPLVPPNNTEEANQRLEQILLGESFHSIETKEMRKDGRFFDAQLTLSPIINKSGEMVAMSLITRDISYRKEAEKLIIQSDKLKLAGEIAAGVAHEIRNPMTVISGFIQMMNEDDQHPYQTYTKLIESELERINLIISEFLVLSKPHVSTAKAFDLESTLQDVVLLFSPELNLRGILLTESFSAPDSFVVGEPNQIKQVFINILKNSIEALDERGSLDITTNIEEDGLLGIHILDNGTGMTQEVVEQIFEPFFTTKSSGTGLGMMISEKIIHEHGGTIKIASKVDVGTKVSIYLPTKEHKKSASSN
ncbi:PAS domain S-box protein [Paenisporosarcina indica]|uniref:PAS domain S-box protein n=1 Tax=Paenisporosarcina indica TaxID=650093 RepID=UPI00094FD8A9|nr:PAS domain S-box protein [Paenisporosarcina indica]